MRNHFEILLNDYGKNDLMVMTSSNGGFSCRCRNRKEEESLEAENPTVEMNPKNPMSRAEQEHENCGHAENRNWCASCVEVRGVGRQLQVEPLEGGFGLWLLDPGECRHIFNSDSSRQQTWCERKGPTAYTISYLVDWETLLKDGNESSMKVFQEAMIHSCVEVAVREMKRYCRILRISAEHNTSVRTTDDIQLLNWFLRFAIQFLNKMRTGRRWRKPMAQFGEKIWFHIMGEAGINSFVKSTIQGIFVGHHDRTRAIS